MLPTKEDLNVLHGTKLNINDVFQYLPDKEKMKKEVQGIVNARLGAVDETIQATKEEVDLKMVKIRKDFDMNDLKKQIERKADIKDMDV